MSAQEEAPAKRVSSGRRAQDRLDRSSWIDGANNLLIQQGVDGIKIERLAASLSVTKGSFYWHFKDRGALLDAVLEDWQRRLTLAIIESLEGSGMTPRARLRALLALRQKSNRNERDARIELALRLWARSDDRAQMVVRETDELRMKFFTEIFLDHGYPRADARSRAVLAYSYMRVSASLLYRRDDDELAGVEAALLGSSN